MFSDVRLRHHLTSSRLVDMFILKSRVSGGTQRVSQGEFALCNRPLSAAAACWTSEGTTKSIGSWIGTSQYRHIFPIFFCSPHICYPQHPPHLLYPLARCPKQQTVVARHLPPPQRRSPTHSIPLHSPAHPHLLRPSFPSSTQLKSTSRTSTDTPAPTNARSSSSLLPSTPR